MVYGEHEYNGQKYTTYSQSGDTWGYLGWDSDSSPPRQLTAREQFTEFIIDIGIPVTVIAGLWGGFKLLQGLETVINNTFS